MCVCVREKEELGVKSKCKLTLGLHTIHIVFLSSFRRE